MTDVIWPDFVTLFPVCRCGKEDTCPQCGSFQLAPRMAAELWARCQILADGAYDEVETYGDKSVDPDEAWFVFSEFPMITWSQKSAWRRQCARAFDDLVGDLEAGRWPEPTCPADEMALHLAIQVQQDIEEEWLDEKLVSLPSHPDDEDWDGAVDALFQDTDILALFDPSQDGLEDPESDINVSFRIGDYRPAAWFKTFSNMETRDERRGFRR